MKKQITVLGLAIAFACSAQATSNDNNGVQKQLDDLRASLHDVHMNTLQKYSESWGLEDRANIAKLQETKLDKSVFTADQARQDKALADSITKQAATDSKQTSDLKSYADKKADSAYSTSVAHTDSKVARADADRAKGDAALQTQITGNLSTQSDRDAGQDQHINAVQDAAQTANDRATNLEVRADGAESGIRETNKQLEITDKRSQNNAVRLDGVEAVNTQQSEAISQEARTRASQVVQLSAGISQAQATGEYAASRADQAFSNAAANSQSIRRTNERVAEHSAQLANHEQRITGLEQKTNRNFGALRNQVERNKKDADAGIASVAAMANLPQLTESARFSAGVGVGARSSQQAIAVGLSSRLSHSVIGKASVASDTNSGWTVGAGVAVQW